MGYQDRDWYKDQHKEQARGEPPSSRRFDRVGPRPGRPVFVRAKPPGLWSRILNASAWKIALFWVVFVAGLTAYFQPIAAERAAKRLIKPAVQLFCSAGAKCT